MISVLSKCTCFMKSFLTAPTTLRDPSLQIIAVSAVKKVYHSCRDPSSFPSTHPRFVTTCNSSSRRVQHFWPPQASSCTHASVQACMNIHKIKIINLGGVGFVLSICGALHLILSTQQWMATKNYKPCCLSSKTPLWCVCHCCSG